MAVKKTPKINVTKLMDVGMGDGAEVTPKKRRGRPKKLQTLAEVEAEINLKEFKKLFSKKLDAAKLMNKNAKGTEKLLMQSNMILQTLQKLYQPTLQLNRKKKKKK